MRHLAIFTKYLAYTCLAVFVLLASSILASTIYTDFIVSEDIEAKSRSPRTVKKIERAYRGAKHKAEEEGKATWVTVPNLDPITQDTATGTCFTSSGKHTDCNGEPTASFVTVRQAGSKCSIMANAHGVISTHCEKR